MGWQEELLKEKSVLEVYNEAKKIAGSDFNRTVARFFALFLAIAMLMLFAFSTPENAKKISSENWLYDWANAGIAFSTSILGFLIAGFSIFATITKNEIFVGLAQIPYVDGDKKSNISRLKFIFFNFMIAFVHYLAFLAACLFAAFLLTKSGPAALILSDIVTNKSYQSYIQAGIAWALATWFVYVLLLLKSFIWNLYQSILFTVTAEAELNKKK